MRQVAGDVGARHLIGQHAGAVVEIEAADDASLIDIDTPEALGRLRGGFGVSAIRAQFPIFAAQPQPFHYLDNAATGQICQAAAEALWRFETTARANVKRGVYRLADEATDGVPACAASRSRPMWVPATPDEIVFTSGCTLALNTAAHTLEPAPAARRRDPAFASSSITATSCRGRWRPNATGARIRAIPVTEEGRLDLDRLDEPRVERARASSPSATPPTSPVPWPRSARLREAADRWARCSCWTARRWRRTARST